MIFTFFKRAGWLAFLFCTLMTLLVASHEAAHMVVARLLGVKVDAFSIGFGPVLASVHDGAMEWRLSALPLGGYVSIPDEAMLHMPWYKIVLISLAGPLSNLLIAIGISMFVLFYGGWLLEQYEATQNDEKRPWNTPIGLLRNVDLNIAKNGLGGFLYSMSIASMALAVLNVLPIPPLDGGHAVLAVYNAIWPSPAEPVAAGSEIANWALYGLLAVALYMAYKDVRDWNNV